MLNALRNNAKYLKDNMEFNVPSENVLYVAKPMDISMALKLEGYPNRDSTKFLFFKLDILNYTDFKILRLFKEELLDTKDIVS